MTAPSGGYRCSSANMSRRSAVCLCLLVAFTPLALGQSSGWLQVRSPHFLVISNASEKNARQAALQFEGMRSVFQTVFPDANLDTVEPMLGLAVQDKATLRTLEPAAYLGQGQLNLVGLFLPALERNYVLVLLNVGGIRAYGPIYHEYAHFVFGRTHQWMPLWLSEGIAEFYQNTEILDGKVRIGKGDPYTHTVLERNALLPLATLLAVDQHSSYYHEQDKGSIFYAESWALTHFLKDKDSLESTHRLNDYLDLLQTKVDPVTAATQAFGDLDQLQQDLRKYVLAGEYAITEISGSSNVDDSSFTADPLSPTQAAVLRADFLAHDQRGSDARALLESVLRDDPENAPAHEIMGYIAYAQQNFDETRKWCQEAIKLDPNNFVAHYYLAAALIRKQALDKASQGAIEESLHKVMQLNPSFAFGYDAMAMFYAMRGVNLTEAYDLIQTAVQLEPGVPEVRVDEAQILAAMHKDEGAISVLDLALKMTHTPEQTAAVENVMQSLRNVAAQRTKSADDKIVVLPRNAPANAVNNRTASTAAETAPRAIYAPEVEYTEEARQAKLEGVCVLSLIVGVDGKPSNIVVTKKLGMGLDEKAVEAVRKSRFEPGRRYGRPVATRLTLNVQFKLFGLNTEKYFELSEKAKAGDAAAEFELANAFLQGRDIPKNESEGLALLERAARSGHAAAEFQMGERTYGDGNNPVNYVDAYAWYALAQRNGDGEADAKVNELENRMTPGQLEDGKKRLQELSASQPE